MFSQTLTEEESETLQSAWCTIKKKWNPSVCDYFVLIIFLSLVFLQPDQRLTQDSAFSYYINPFSYSSKYDSSLILDICQNLSMIDSP